MWWKRVLVALVLMPIGLAAMFVGEAYFAIVITIILALAAKEYCELMKIGGAYPADLALYGVIVAIGTGVTLWPELDSLVFMAIFILLASGWHLWQFEGGREQALKDLAASYAGILYLGFLGSFFMRIRMLPGGEWWLLVVLTSVWFADTGAYMIGSWLGKTPLAIRLSPKKTWEGYISGVVVTLIGSPLLLLLYWRLGWPVDGTITIARVIMIGGIISVLVTGGDLTISMLKRGFHVKDTGTILPGHGGMLDRIDSWLWAVTIGYYLITAIFLI